MDITKYCTPEESALRKELCRVSSDIRWLVGLPKSYRRYDPGMRDRLNALIRRRIEIESALGMYIAERKA